MQTSRRMFVLWHFDAPVHLSPRREHAIFLNVTYEEIQIVRDGMLGFSVEVNGLRR